MTFICPEKNCGSTTWRLEDGRKSTLKVTFPRLCLGAALCAWTGCCTCLVGTIPEAIQTSSTCWIRGLQTEGYSGKGSTAKESLHHQRTNLASGCIKTSTLEAIGLGFCAECSCPISAPPRQHYKSMEYVT